MHCRKLVLLFVTTCLALITQAQQTLVSLPNANKDSAKGSGLLSYRQLPDILYSKEGKDNKDNRLDIYLPRDYNNARVIVYLHGGSWIKGDKSEFPKQLIEELVGKREYIVTSANYRLVKDGNNTFPAQIEDVSKALAFLSDNAEKYHYNGNEFTLMGASAGALIDMLYAYGYDPEKQVKTVVDIWGPTDLSDKAVRADNKVADNIIINLLGVANPGNN